MSKALLKVRSAETIELEIEALDLDGDGVARAGRRTLAVPFTIPGERVRVRVSPRPRPDGTFPADLVDIVRPSSHRVVPGCRHFGPQPDGREACGGCAWQHIAYPEQLRLKTERLTRLVRSAVPHAPAARAMWSATPVDAPWGFRHKVHFVFGASAGRQPRLLMGHFARGSRRVVGVEECPVHAAAGNALGFALRDACASAGVRAAGSPRQGPEGVLKSVTVRVARATAERMMTVVVTDDADRALRGATRRALARGGADTSLHVNLHPRADAFIFGRETRRIAGTERMRDEVAGVSFLMSPTAFFQTNVAAAEQLVSLVRAAVPSRVPVLDLYAGAGLFALPLAQAGHDVVAVEANAAAVADGEASRALNRIPAGRCRWVTGAVESALSRAAAFDHVVLDPPREGCSAAVRHELFAVRRPARLIYVSCNPETLARDLGAAAGHGYEVASLQPVDMFPHTAHVETVAVLRRAGAV